MKALLSKFVFTAGATSIFLNVGILGIEPVLANQLKNLYVFGDSLVDGGRYYQLTNYSFPPSQLGYYQGRFTNDLVFPEIMAQKMNLNYSLANNYAIGGSGTDDFHPSGLSGLGLKSQITTYLNNRTKAQNTDLYLISSGSNDYRNLDPSDGILNDIQPVVNNLSIAVTRLANAGAKNFMVVGLPDFGKIPGNVKHNWGTPAETQAALALLSDVTNIHNQLLVESLQKLNNTLKIDITFFDLNPTLYEALEPNNIFGFTNVTDGCLNISIDVIAAGQIPSEPPCSDPDRYLFYDLSHPTSAAHRYLADAAIKDLDLKKNIIEKKKIKDIKTDKKVYNLAGFGSAITANDIEQVPEPGNQFGLFVFSILGIGKLLTLIRK